MSDKLDFDKLAADLREVLQTHNLDPIMHGVSLSLPKVDFDRLAADHPGHHPTMILVTSTNWYVKISRQPELE